MASRGERAAEFLRANAAGLGVGAVLLAGAGVGVRWIVSNRSEAMPPRKVMQFAVVSVQPQPPPAKPPPPPPQSAPQPKEIETPQPNRVELKMTDAPPPDAPPPPGPAAGPLALAAAGDGPGDAFNLAGNPGGRGLLSGGGLGDGAGGGLGDVDPNARYAWYYARMVPGIEAAIRKSKRLSRASGKFDLRLWSDASGRLTRVQPVRAAEDPSIDEELQRVVVGLRVPPPPPDVPMPLILHIDARRPQ